ncbi:MAG: shikimate kinase [Planctomycetaceae bacterium]
MLVTLIGYRGVGKSAVGQQLAARLGIDFADADVEIEHEAGLSIPAIFASEGEPGFRRREADAIARLLQRDRLVLASGGGAILADRTRERMQQAGPVVWLKASVATIWDRIGHDLETASTRPALTSAPPREEVERLLTERTPLYREIASIAIDTDDRTVTAIVDEIQSRLPPQGDDHP